MTILDTFYLLFKTDAAGAAKNDIKSLESQIDSLTAKGKKRSEEETKSLLQARRQHKELTDQIKLQRREVEDTTNSFVKMAESASSALAALFSLSAIKSGVFKNQQVNSALEVQAKLTGQNASALRVYAAAAAAAGGSQQGFLGDFQGLFGKLAGQGLRLPDIRTALDHARGIVQQYKTPEGRELAFQRLGINDPGLKGLLSQSNEQYAKSIEAAEKHARVTKEDADAAREFGKEWSLTVDSVASAFTHLGTDIFPVIEPFLKSFREFLDSLREHKGATEAFFAAATVGVSLLTGAFVRLAASIAGVGTAGLGAFGKVGILGLFAAAPELGSEAGTAIGGWINKGVGGGVGHWLRQTFTKGGDPVMNAATDARLRESYAFWMQNGYSASQAAALVGNEQGEGGTNGARGDGGSAGGIAQWHQNRRELIRAATGIDVWNASHGDQLKAQLWEMQHRGISPGSLPGDIGGASAFLVNRYEMTANQGRDAALRAGYASQFQSRFAGSKSMSVKIDDVNIHTQATDAAGISKEISNSLVYHLGTAIANHDDGVDR